MTKTAARNAATNEPASTKAWTWNGPRKVLNLGSYVPALLTAITSGLSSGPARRHLKGFGLGIIEWRMVAALAACPDMTASEICQTIGLDKAAASRSLLVLERLKFVSGADDPKDQRTRRFKLISAGLQFHDRIFPIALERERLMLAQLSSKDIGILIDLLNKIRDQMPSVKAYNPLKRPTRGKRKAKPASGRG